MDENVIHYMSHNLEKNISMGLGMFNVLFRSTIINVSFNTYFLMCLRTWRAFIRFY